MSETMVSPIRGSAGGRGLHRTKAHVFLQEIYTVLHTLYFTPLFPQRHRVREVEQVLKGVRPSYIDIVLISLPLKWTVDGYITYKFRYFWSSPSWSSPTPSAPHVERLPQGHTHMFSEGSFINTHRGPGGLATHRVEVRGRPHCHSPFA